MHRILGLPVVFIGASIFLLGLVSYGPGIPEGGLKFPGNFEEVKALSSRLRQYQRVHWEYVLFLFSAAYLYKQTFAIPGSLFLNLLAGAQFGLPVALPLTTILTATGATFCYFISWIFCKNVVFHYFDAQLESLRIKIKRTERSVAFFLLFARLFPGTPNWLLNIVSPYLDIPVPLFFFTVLLGLLPYNFVTTQAGSVLSDLQSTRDIFDTGTLSKLCSIAIFCLIFGVYMQRSRNKIL